MGPVEGQAYWTGAYWKCAEQGSIRRPQFHDPVAFVDRTQMEVPSNAQAWPSDPTGNEPSNAPSLARIFEMMPAAFPPVTQTFAPSKQP